MRQHLPDAAFIALSISLNSAAQWGGAQGIHSYVPLAPHTTLSLKWYSSISSEVNQLRLAFCSRILCKTCVSCAHPAPEWADPSANVADLLMAARNFLFFNAVKPFAVLSKRGSLELKGEDRIPLG